MPVDQLRMDIPPASKNKVGGAIWNRLAGMVNAPINGYPVLPGTTGPGMAGINVGGGMTMMPAQMTMVGTVIVTSIEDTCPEDLTEDDATWAPCRSNRKYMAKWRRWASGSGSWVTTDEEERAIDVGAWWPDETSPLTSGPILLVNDIIPVVLDIQRGMFVPLWFPNLRPVILTTALAVGGTATAAVLKRITSNPWWQRVVDGQGGSITLQVADLTLNTGDPSWEVNTIGVAVWCIDTWLFVPLNCDPNDTGI